VQTTSIKRWQFEFSSSYLNNNVTVNNISTCWYQGLSLQIIIKVIMVNYLFLFLAWQPSWLEVGITGHKFGRGPSMDHSTNVWLQLAQWFLRRRLKHVQTTSIKRWQFEFSSSYRNNNVTVNNISTCWYQGLSLQLIIKVIISGGFRGGRATFFYSLIQWNELQF
jgi:hypothetical protein